MKTFLSHKTITAATNTLRILTAQSTAQLATAARVTSQRVMEVAEINLQVAANLRDRSAEEVAGVTTRRWQ